MRMVQLFVPTLFEDPQEAEIISHKLMLRAGLIRKLASGVYSYLPVGLRVLQKIMTIVREEMNAIGCQEVLLPALQPAQLWQETGRWQAYGEDMFKLKDRKGSNFGLAPTHEETITDLVRKEVRSYRQLPISFYQIQTKFRDEPRPRFGTIRSREFLMKDAYSFHINELDANVTYQSFYQAYNRIFTRCGLEFKIVEAEAGLIGGSFSHEFMALAESGEDTIVECHNCNYAANLERAECRQEEKKGRKGEMSLTLVSTPGMRTVEEVSHFLKIQADHLIKTLIYLADNQPVGVLVGGDGEVNESKLRKVLMCQELALADAETIKRVTQAPVGFAGPIGLKGVNLIADYSLQNRINLVAGGNKEDSHYINVNFERDFQINEWADIKVAQEGDICPRCPGRLKVSKGIELGHTFKLGTKYSQAMKAGFLDENGQEIAFFMGCYGIGVSRLIPAIIEQNHDQKGIIWPNSVAPYLVVILPLNVKDKEQVNLAEDIYTLLQREGIEVLLDDRDESAGRKFNDAELIGLPIQVIIGNKTKTSGKIEVCQRRTKEKELVDYSSLVEKIRSSQFLS